MHKEDLLLLRVGKCGSCGLTLRFWGLDGLRVDCFHCGCRHEVEVDNALNLSSGQATEITMLVPVREQSEYLEWLSLN